MSSKETETSSAPVWVGAKVLTQTPDNPRECIVDWSPVMANIKGWEVLLMPQYLTADLNFELEGAVRYMTNEQIEQLFPEELLNVVLKHDVLPPAVSVIVDKVEAHPYVWSWGLLTGWVNQPVITMSGWKFTKDEIEYYRRLLNEWKKGQGNL